MNSRIDAFICMEKAFRSGSTKVGHAAAKRIADFLQRAGVAVRIWYEKDATRVWDGWILTAHTADRILGAAYSASVYAGGDEDYEDHLVRWLTDVLEEIEGNTKKMVSGVTELTEETRAYVRRIP